MLNESFSVIFKHRDNVLSLLSNSKNWGGGPSLNHRFARLPNANPPDRDIDNRLYRGDVVLSPGRQLFETFALGNVAFPTGQRDIINTHILKVLLRAGVVDHWPRTLFQVVHTDLYLILKKILLWLQSIKNGRVLTRSLKMSNFVKAKAVKLFKQCVNLKITIQFTFK